VLAFQKVQVEGTRVQTETTCSDNYRDDKHPVGDLIMF